MLGSVIVCQLIAWGRWWHNLWGWGVNGSGEWQWGMAVGNVMRVSGNVVCRW